jgi:hypothetical protein
VVWAALAYLAVGTVALWPSIRPGRTLVAADVLGIDAPYSSLPGRPAIHNILLSDTPFQFFPWLAYTGRAVRDGHLPQWNPSILGGVPVTPSGFVNVYYPPTWLTAVLSPFDAYNAFVLLHLVLGALGVFLFARALGARPVPAWIGGLLAFAAAFWVHWSTHLLHVAGMVWLPWALLATTRLVEEPTRRRVAGLALVFGLWWLGANPQYAFYGTLAMVGYAAALLLHRRLSGRGRLLAPAAAFAGALAVGGALTAPVMLPTVSRAAEVVRNGDRGATGGHMPKRQAIRLLVPDAYGNARDGVYFQSNVELEMDSPFLGVTALLLFGACLPALDTAAKRVLCGGVVAVLLLVFTGQPHRLLALVPGYDRFRVTFRWLSVLPAVLLPLAATGLDRLAAGDRRARRALLGAGVVSCLAVATWFLLVRGTAGAPEPYFFRRGMTAIALVGGVVGAGVLVSTRPRAGLAAVVVLALVEIGMGTTRWYPSVPERGAYPAVPVAEIAKERGGRLVRVGGERTTFPPYAPDLTMVSGGQDTQGLTVLFPTDYDRFLRVIDDYGSYAKLFNAAPPLADPAALSSRLLDVLDVRTVVAAPDVGVPADYPLLDDGDPRVYARPSLGPAALVPTAAPAGEDEMWRQVASPSWDPGASAAVEGLRQLVHGGPGTVRAAGPPRPEREDWDVDAPAGGFLRVSGNWDEGWSARVDGRAVPVLRADGIFRGVVVPAGHHRVRFTYSNVDEGRGRLAALGALGAIAALVAPLPRLSGLRRRGGRPAAPDPPPASPPAARTGSTAATRRR